ncbi:MAG: exodeoxyribonuclease III, partial [Candidatus Tectomicrobia bacterium]
MRIATWNVNSIRARLELVLQWLEQDGPDVVCLQETKVTDDLFPIEPLQDVGYQTMFTGQKTYNGVAILSRFPIADVRTVLPNAPGDDEKRFIAASIEGVRVINVYVPNGREVSSPAFQYKLDWMECLCTYLVSMYTLDDAVLLCGDFNLAPEPRDVYDAAKADGHILFHPDERAAFTRLLDWGLCDALRLHHHEAGLYSWWDYRAAAFRRNVGFRIDHLLLTPPLAEQ